MVPHPARRAGGVDGWVKETVVIMQRAMNEQALESGKIGNWNQFCGQKHVPRRNYTNMGKEGRGGEREKIK